MLTLRQLRYLDALARQRNFGRAADECAVSQPALSMQIRELEDFLGGELIERRQGDAILTERGLQIAEKAASILSAARELVEFARHNGRLLIGNLKVGVVPTLAPYILPQLIPRFQSEYPDLCLNFIETQGTTLMNELSHGNVDLALLVLPDGKNDVETMHLFDDRLLLAVPADDPLPEQARVTIYDVEQRKLILHEECQCPVDQALMCSAGIGNDKNSGFLATSLTTIIQMVASGYGATLLPEIAVDMGLRDERVKLLRFSDPQPQRKIGLMWRRSSPRKEDFLAFGRLIVETMQGAPSVGFRLDQNAGFQNTQPPLQSFRRAISRSEQQRRFLR